MTLRDVILAVEAEAKAQPAVKMIVRNDIFRLNDMPDAEYGVFGWTQQQHSVGDGDLLRVTLNLWYVDRLNENASNELEVQSMGVQVLANVIRSLPAEGVYLAGEAAIRTFNQKFVDVCAGAFATLSLLAPVDTICETNYTDNSVPIL